MLSRVTAGDVLERVVQALADMRSPERLLAVILSETMRMLDAQGAYMLWVVGDRLQLRASAGLVPPGRDAGLRLGAGPEGWVAQQGEPLAVANLARYRRSGSERLGLVGALLVVPMRLRGGVVGVLAATRDAPGRFAESDRWWLSIFAELAAVALENARLIERERRRAREAEVLAELAALPTEPAQEFAARLADAVNPVLDAQRTEVLVSDAAGYLQPLGASGQPLGAGGVPPDDGAVATARAGGKLEAAPRGARDGPRPSAGSGRSRGEDASKASLAGAFADVYRQGEPLLCNDVAQLPNAPATVVAAGLRSLLVVPLWVGDARRGVVWVGATRPGAFGADDQMFLTLVAARVGLRLGAAELARRRAEIERAEVEQKAKQDFLSVVSHELKTPVAVIKAYTEVLEGRAERAGAAAAIDREVLSRVGEQADRMLGLVDQFLDLQRIEAGLMPLEESRFDVADVARRLAQATQVTTTAHQLRVEASRPVYVRADRRRVEQVLQNLLDNAIKYSPEGGPIVVRVGETLAREGRPEMALVTVHDQGVGMSSEAATRVFQRFYQAGTVPVRGHVGLGLGLYISRGIVTRHGGEMWVESKEGKGSTFAFTLPLSTSRRETSARQQSD
jgi:signal transduction histidine kinase